MPPLERLKGKILIKDKVKAPKGAGATLQRGATLQDVAEDASEPVISVSTSPGGKEESVTSPPPVESPPAVPVIVEPPKQKVRRKGERERGEGEESEREKRERESREGVGTRVVIFTCISFDYMYSTWF